MRSFPLKIVTPDGLKYDGPADALTVRTISGDMGVLAGHMNCVAPLGTGRAIVVMDGKKQCGTSTGGMITVLDGSATLICPEFVWEADPV